MEVTYLTNACGEETGYGSIVPTEADLALVGFEQGPGQILQYLAEIEGKAYVLGNLEIACKGDFFDNEDFPEKAEAEAIASKVADEMKVRILDGAKILPLDDGMPGRVTIGLAIPLDTLSSRQEAGIAFRAAFGAHCDANCYVWHGEGECDNVTTDLAEAFLWQKEFDLDGEPNTFLTDIDNDLLDPSLVEKYCAPILAKQNHTPKMGM